MPSTFIKPKDITDQLEIKDGFKIADFGSGSGYFSIKLVKAAGTGGKVFAIDIQETALESVRSRAKADHLYNIETVKADLEKPDGSGLSAQSIDLVFMANILHQSQNKAAILKEAGRILKKDGMLAALEWHKNTPLSPKEGWLIEKEDLEKLAGEAGFQKEKDLETDGFHYGIVFRKILNSNI